MSDPLTPPAAPPLAPRAHAHATQTRPMRERGSSPAHFAEGDPRGQAWFEWEKLLDAGLIGTPRTAAAAGAEGAATETPAGSPAPKRNLDRMLLALRGPR